MGEISKGSDSLDKNREVFYSSGVDRLARFIDQYPREIRVSLFYVTLLILNVYRMSRIIARRYQKVGIIKFGPLFK